MRFFLFLLFFCSQAALSQTVYVPATRLLRAKGYEIFLGGDYFKTSKTVPPKQSPESLKSGESFQRTQVEAGGRYGLAHNFQVGVAARFRQNSSTAVDVSTGDKINASSSGLQSIATTFSFGLKPTKRMAYILEGFFRYVPYSYSEIPDPGNFNRQNDLILGDVGNEYGAGGAATYNFAHNNFLTGKAGWRKPGDFLSPEIYWQVEAASAWKTIALVAGVDGVTSLHDGDDTRPFYNIGRTNLYHGYNREWVSPYLGANFALGNTWRVELRGSQVVSGHSTDLGTAFGIQLIRRVEPSKTRIKDAAFKTYDYEVTVTKVSPKKSYVVVDKGISSDIEKGMVFDFYDYDYLGGNVLVAQGVVIESRTETAIVKITQFYKKDIKVGLIGRGQLK
jgi:hypothetical protein